MPLPPAPSKKATILPTSAYANPGEGNSRKTSSRSRAADSAHPEAKLEAPEPLLVIPSAPAAPTPAKAPSRRKTASTQVSALLSPPAAAPAVAKSTPTTPAAAPTASTAPAAAEAPASAPRSRKARHTGPTKLFVLDTNVLMHDPMCLFRFEEHDIFLPMIVLEELDSHKKGMTEVARNARQTSRSLDALAAAQGADITAGLKLDTTGHREAGGKLFFQTRPLNYTLPTIWPRWSFFALIVIALTGTALPIAYFLHLRFPSTPPVLPHVILREALWVGVYGAVLTWLQLARILTFGIGLWLAIGTIVIEYLWRWRERSQVK